MNNSTAGIFNVMVPEETFASTTLLFLNSTPATVINPEDENDPVNAAVFCGIIIPCFLIGVFGHVLVLLSVFYHEELYRPLNVIVVMQSIAQFFMLFITVFGSAIAMLNMPRYTFPIDHRDILCFFTLFFSTATSIFYGFIAINRVMAIIYESVYAKFDAWKIAWILSILGWMLSLFSAVFPWMTPALVGFAWDTYFLFGYPWFTAASSDNSAFAWVLMCGFFLVPALSVIICYIALFFHWSSSQQLAGVPINSQKAINLRDRAGVLLMLGAASLIYLICYYASYFYWSAGNRRKMANYFFLWLVYIQNALNPVIYGVIYPKFREAYFRVMLWILRRWSCRKPYGDGRIFPAGMPDIAGPPSVVYHSAKNSVVFQNGGLNGAVLNENQFITVKQLPTTTKNLEIKSTEIISSHTSRSHHSSS